MRVLIIPFAALALFATATYGSATMVNKASGFTAGDMAQISWQMAKGTDRTDQR